VPLPSLYCPCSSSAPLHSNLCCSPTRRSSDLCRSFGRRMIPRGRGSIVTLGSINSVLPLPLPAYNPGKAAVARLTQLLAVELGRHGIRVNSVAPTYVMTPPLRAKVEAGQRDLNKIMSVHALSSLPEPSDI